MGAVNSVYFGPVKGWGLGAEDLTGRRQVLLWKRVKPTCRPLTASNFIHTSAEEIPGGWWRETHLRFQALAARLVIQGGD